MFSRKTNASKVALVSLCAVLKKHNFSVFDTQFINNHLKQFGAYELSQNDYLQKISLITSENNKSLGAEYEGEALQCIVEQYIQRLVNKKLTDR